MDKKKNGKNKIKYILRGLKNALLCDCIGIVGLSLVGTIIALFKHSSITRGIYMALYFGGAFILLVSIPQFYKKNRHGGSKNLQSGTPLFGFYGWFGSSYDLDTSDREYEEFVGEGFWLGIMLFVAGIVLLGAGVIMEKIFFVS